MLVINNTPWEVYDIDGVDIYVKREDLCCPDPGPSFSKIRGVERYLKSLHDNPVVGVMDTRHSKAGWGVAYICKELGLKCIDFYPVLKSEANGLLRDYQIRAKELGAMLYPMKAGMSAVLFNRAKSIMKDRGIMLPNGLHLQESVDATSDELIHYTPRNLLSGTWVVSISSGTLGAGVVKGLSLLNFGGNIIFHMGYTRNQEKVRKMAGDMAGIYYQNLFIVDEGFEYKDSVPNNWVPFPCNEYYDAKAFTWLAHHVHQLQQPIVFWNIGA